MQLCILFLLACLWAHQGNAFRMRYCKSGRLPLFASTGPAPQPTWYPSQIVTNTKDGDTLRQIKISVPEEITSAFINPGQYVQIKVGDNKPGFYAIASAPSDSRELTFLVKETDSNSPLTTSLSASTVSLSLPQGKGFRIGEFFDNYQADWAVFNVLLLACGSGLAPIASVLDSGVLKLGATPTFFPPSASPTVPIPSILPGASRSATLYIGARSEAHLPLKEKYSAWESSGVKVVPVLSQPAAGWGGKKGYIQDALAADTVRTPRNSAALLCGQRGMADKAKEILLTAGVFEGRILFNF